MKIAIIGFGKMGSWLANALAEGNEIAVYEKDPQKATGNFGFAVLEKLADLEKFAPEILINAVTLSSTIAAFDETIKYLPKNCTLCDVASVKSGLEQFYSSAGFEFVSLHPMFGPTNADMALPKGENAIIISQSSPRYKEFFRKFFEKLGLNIFEYTFDRHDEMMAYSLTTPFVASLVFASCVDNTKVPGTNFARHLGISRGLLSEDDSLLSEILFNKYSTVQISRINSKLEFLKHVIDAHDNEEASRFFAKLRKNVSDPNAL